MELRFRIAAFVALIVTAGCSRSPETTEGEPLPTHYGIFVVADGRLRELNSISHTRVTQISEGTGAAEFDNVANILSGTGLFFISYGFDGAVLATAAEPGKSRRFRVDQNVPLDIRPLHGRRDMQRLTPTLSVSHGPYLLSVRGCLDNSWNRRCYYPFAVD